MQCRGSWFTPLHVAATSVLFASPHVSRVVPQARVAPPRAQQRRALACVAALVEAGATLDDDYGAWPSRRHLETPLEALAALEAPARGGVVGHDEGAGAPQPSPPQSSMVSPQLREELRALLERATFGGLALAHAEPDEESRMFALD